MNLLIMAILIGWQALLFKIAIAVVIAWGVCALIQWWGWIPPQPVKIIATVLFSILLIYWLFELFNMLVT